MEHFRKKPHPYIHISTLHILSRQTDSILKSLCSKFETFIVILGEKETKLKLNLIKGTTVTLGRKCDIIIIIIIIIIKKHLNGRKLVNYQNALHEISKMKELTDKQ